MKTNNNQYNLGKGKQSGKNKEEKAQKLITVSPCTEADLAIGRRINANKNKGKRTIPNTRNKKNNNENINDNNNNNNNNTPTTSPDEDNEEQGVLYNVTPRNVVGLIEVSPKKVIIIQPKIGKNPSWEEEVEYTYIPRGMWLGGTTYYLISFIY